MSKRIDIRCPFKYRSKVNNKIYTCNHLCFRVDPGSSGEAWCNKCKLSFDFSVNNQAIFDTKVKVKKHD